MSIRNHSITSICIVMITIGLLLIPIVSSSSNIVTSSTGKFIFKSMDYSNIVLPTNPKEIFFFINYVPSKTPHYDENATACGANGCNWDGNYPNYNVIMNIPIQPHYNMTIKLPPATDPLVIADTSTACGMCGGNPFIKSFTNPW